MYLLPARSLDSLLFFTDKGKVYSERVYQIPDSGRADKGLPLTNILSIEAGEQVTATLPVPNFEDAGFCVMVTRNGRIKRVAMSEFAAVRPSGLIATNLEDGDVLGWAKMTDGKQEIILVTERGQALRYAEDEVRAMGRQAAGVTAIRLDEGDHITSMDVVDAKCDLLVVTANGYGKRTPLEEYTPKGRATMGIATIAQRTLEVTGNIVSARVVSEDDEITVISTNGQALRLKVKHIRQAGRATMGTHLINLKEGDTVASVARLSAKDLEPVTGEPKDGKSAVEAVVVGMGIGSGDDPARLDGGSGNGAVHEDGADGVEKA
jgi:DNA gyrase subunit A